MASDDVRLRVEIYADGRTAVRAFGQVSEASKKTAVTMEEDGRKAEASLDRTRAGAEKLKGTIGTLASTVGLGGLAFGFADLVKQGEQWQLQQAQLQNALKTTGQDSESTIEQVRKAAESLSVKGGFAGPEEISAMTQFIRLTGSATRSIQLNQAATDLARATGMDYSATQKMIGQVLTGNTGRLQRYLGIIEPVKTAEFALSQAHQTNVFQLEAQSKALGNLGPAWLRQQEILHNLTPAALQHAQMLDRQATAVKVLGLIQNKYGGSTATFSRQTAGAISNLRNQFDLFAESAGRKVLPAVQAVAKFLTKHIGVVLALTFALGGLAIVYGIVKAATEVYDAVVVVSSATTTGAAAAVGALSGAVETCSLVMMEQGVPAALAITAAWAGATLGLAALVAGLVYAVTHWKQTKAAIMDVFDWIKGHWPLLVGILLSPFTGGLSLLLPLIVAHFNQIIQFFSSVPARIGHALSSVGGFISDAFDGAINGVIHALNWLIDRIDWVIGKVDSLHISTPFGNIGLPTVGKIGHIGDVGSTATAIGGGDSAVVAGATAGLAASGTRQHHATGGPIYRAAGGPIYRAAGGPIGTDTVPMMATPGEYMIRRESVESIGTGTLDAINATGELPRSAGEDSAWVTVPITVQAGGRVITETVARVAARRAALAGRGALSY